MIFCYKLIICAKQLKTVHFYKDLSCNITIIRLVKKCLQVSCLPLFIQCNT